MTKSAVAWCAGLIALMCVGCGDDEKEPSDCDPQQANACESGLVCEQLGASRHACLAPVVVSGRVFDALDEAAVRGATIVGVDANGAGRTRVVRSGANGSYQLPVSVQRDDDGAPLADALTLRVSAADHQPFPLAPRAALPIDLAAAERVADKSYRIANAATDVALIPLPMAQRGGVTVEGKVSASSPAGVLIVGVVGTAARSTTVSDLDGSFVLFNVPPGALRIEGSRAGLGLEPQNLSVPPTGLTGVSLTAGSAPLSTVTGSVNIVNAPGGLTTSVILVVASTFDREAVRGEAPAGLRKSAVASAFSIEGVPPGRYAVLAAFENDQLVRDPDLGIAGTDVVFVDIGSAGGTVSLPESFKVTEALGVVSPGTQGVEQVAAGTVNLVWNDDSSEDGYELRVFDALGTQVHANTEVPLVTGSGTVTYALDASTFRPGMLYQMRAYSFKNRQGGRTYLSATEDLRGVFQIAR